VNNPLVLIGGYFVGLFVLVMIGSKVHKRVERNRKDSKRAIIAQIEKVEAAEARQHAMAGR
jgi:hypothetical protein